MSNITRKKVSPEDIRAVFKGEDTPALKFLRKAIRVETIKFKHGNKNLEAMIYKPVGKGPWPLMPFDAGLRTGVHELVFIATILARAGYVVYGTRSRLEVAHVEVDDYFSGIDHIWKNMDFVDKNITVPIGVSSGGSLALGLAADPFSSAYNIRGTIALGGYNDLIEMYAHMCNYLGKNNDQNDYHWKVLDLYKRYAESEMMDFNKNGTLRIKSAYSTASPKNFIKDIKVPILLVHGKDDKIVPSEQAVKNYELAKSLGKDVRLKIVPGESVHNPPEKMLNITNLIGEIETAVEIWRFLDRIKREVHPENYDGRPSY